MLLRATRRSSAFSCARLYVQRYTRVTAVAVSTSAESKRSAAATSICGSDVYDDVARSGATPGGLFPDHGYVIKPPPPTTYADYIGVDIDSNAGWLARRAPSVHRSEFPAGTINPSHRSQPSAVRLSCVRVADPVRPAGRIRLVAYGARLESVLG